MEDHIGGPCWIPPMELWRALLEGRSGGPMEGPLEGPLVGGYWTMCSRGQVATPSRFPFVENISTDTTVHTAGLISLFGHLLVGP